MATVDLDNTNSVVLSMGDAGTVLRFPSSLASRTVYLERMDGGASVSVGIGEDGTYAVDSSLLSAGVGAYLGVCIDSDGLAYSFSIELVPRHYCTLDQILDSGLDNGISPRQAKKTEDDAFEARARATETIDEACGRSFVKRTATQTIYAEAGRYYGLYWAGSTVNDERFRQVCDCGVVALSDGQFELTYTHGEDYLPVDISQATALLAASYLTPTNIPSRATGQSTDAGFLRFTIAGVDGATGIPEVDSVIQRRKRERFGVI